MSGIRWDERYIAGGKDKRTTVNGKIDRATQDDRDLFFGMAMDRKDRTGLVNVPHQGLVRTVDSLSRDAVERMLDRDRAPVYGRGFGPGWRVQKTNQPQKSASASRKKKTLATPPPKMR